MKYDVIARKIQFSTSSSASSSLLNCDFITLWIQRTDDEMSRDDEWRMVKIEAQRLESDV